MSIEIEGNDAITILHHLNGNTEELHSEVLHLAVEDTGKSFCCHKSIVTVGRDADCDLSLMGNPNVSRRHATFFYEDNKWYLRDEFSKNGTQINGTKLTSGRKYRLAFNDEISFAAEETFIFEKLRQCTPSVGDPVAKAIAFLEAGMATYAKSGYRDGAALNIICAALYNAPLYFPVEIDLAALFGAADPAKLKVGDTLQPAADVRMRFLTLQTKDGWRFTPIFTSKEKAKSGCDTSVVWLFPQEYLPQLIRTDIDAVINPFSEERVVIPAALIRELMLSIIGNKVESTATDEEVSEDRFVGKNFCGKYEVLQLLEIDGIWSTYLVNDLRIKKKWSMKICDKKSSKFHPAVMEVVLAEVDIQRKLDHPAIPRVIDIFEEDGCVFILQEYIEGETLESVAEREGAMPADRVVEWGKQMCDVLAYLHTQNPPIIHRDVKPKNIILKPDGSIAFTDFEIARTYEKGRTQDTCCLGTKGYAAPEQFGSRQTDARTDIFGLGMTLYRLVTGNDPAKPPYTVKPICQIDSTLPKGLEYIISKCIRLNPEERYKSCGELMVDLNRYPAMPQRGILGKFFGKK